MVALPGLESAHGFSVHQLISGLQVGGSPGMPGLSIQMEDPKHWDLNQSCLHISSHFYLIKCSSLMDTEIVKPNSHHAQPAAKLTPEQRSIREVGPPFLGA